MKTPTSLLLAASIGAIPPALALPVPKSHIGVAGIDFQGLVEANQGHTSNVTYQPYGRDEISSGWTNVKPTFQAIGERYEDRYVLMYAGDYRRYQQDSADDYTDHFLRFTGDWRYGKMHGLTLDLMDNIGHEARGRETTEGFLPGQFEQFGVNQPLKTNYFSGEVRYRYGSPEGDGHIETALLYKQLRYRDLGAERAADADFYDYIRNQEWHEPSLIVELFDLYRKEARFRYSFITNQRRYEINSLKDSDEYFLLYGIQSQMTGKTHIDANISWLYKTFINNPDSTDFNGLNWNIKLQWKPLEQSEFLLHSDQHIKDPSEVGGYILVSEYGLAWTHHWWVDRFSTTVDYAYHTESYKKQTNNRKDTQGLLSLSASYDFRPSVNFEIKYQIDTLRSNKDTDAFYIGPHDERRIDRTLGYDNQLIMLTARVQI